MASNGSYNYYQLLGPDHKGRVKWCEKIGNYVATEVEKRGEGTDSDGPTSLTDFDLSHPNRIQVYHGRPSTRV